MISTLTVLHLSSFPLRMFRACITITPEIMAFVVAIAGIIFPAMAKEKTRYQSMCQIHSDIQSKKIIKITECQNDKNTHTGHCCSNVGKRYPVDKSPSSRYDSISKQIIRDLCSG